MGGRATRVTAAAARTEYTLGKQFAALGATGRADVFGLSALHPLLRSRNREVHRVATPPPVTVRIKADLTCSSVALATPAQPSRTRTSMRSHRSSARTVPGSRSSRATGVDGERVRSSAASKAGIALNAATRVGLRGIAALYGDG